MLKRDGLCIHTLVICLLHIAWNSAYIVQVSAYTRATFALTYVDRLRYFETMENVKCTCQHTWQLPARSGYLRPRN